MKGEVAADIIGSVNEFTKHESFDFQPFSQVKSNKWGLYYYCRLVIFHL